MKKGSCGGVCDHTGLPGTKNICLPTLNNGNITHGATSEGLTEPICDINSRI
jgi:hypothetical protein